MASQLQKFESAPYENATDSFTEIILKHQSGRQFSINYNEDENAFPKRKISDKYAALIPPAWINQKRS